MTKSKKGKTVAAIDADIILYRVAHATDRPITLDAKEVQGSSTQSEETTTETRPMEEEQYTLEDAKAQTDLIIRDILTATGATHYLGFITGYNNFRHGLAKFNPYKANRSKIKPYWFKDIKDHMIEEWNFMVVDDMEADDALSLCRGKEVIICSTDKDLLQIPGRHYNINHDSMVTVTKQEADRLFWMQMIMGDSVDTIPGVKNYGRVKAKQIIEKCTDYHTTVMNLYRQVYGDDGELRFWETYDLVKLLRKPINDFKPPSPMPYTNQLDLPF